MADFMEVEDPGAPPPWQKVVPPQSTAPAPAAPAPSLPGLVSGAIDQAAQAQLGAQPAPAAPAARPGPFVPDVDIKSMSDMATAFERGAYEPKRMDGGLPDPAVLGDRLQAAVSNPWVSTESTSNQWSKKRLDPKSVKAWNDAREKFNAASDKVTQEEAKLNNIATKEKQVLLDQTAAATMRQLERERKINEQNRQRLMKYEQESSKLKLAIDPERSWHNKSGFQKAMFYLAAIGEGYLGRQAGGPSIFDMYQNEVHRDVEAQKAEYEAKKQGLARKWGVYAAFKQLGNDDAEAFRKTVAFKNNSAAEYMRNQIAKASNPLKAAEAEKAAALFETEAQKSLALNQYDSVGGSKTVSQRENPEIAALGSMLNASLATARKEGKFNPQSAKTLEESYKPIQDTQRFMDSINEARKWQAQNPGKAIPIEMRKNLVAGATKFYVLKNKFDESAVQTGEFSTITTDAPDLNDSDQLRQFLSGSQKYDDVIRTVQGDNIKKFHRSAATMAAGGDATAQNMFRNMFNPEARQQFIAKDIATERGSAGVRGRVSQEPSLAGKIGYKVRKGVRSLVEIPTGLSHPKGSGDR